MKYALKPFQEDATLSVVRGIIKGSEEFSFEKELTSISLAAPTGAGKTVIATAVMERLWFGDEENNLQGDTDFTFLWLTDDPSLNEQTRDKVLESSDRIDLSQLITLDERFDQEFLSPGKLYFLNIQKLSKSSNLVRRQEGRREYVLWETIAKTIQTAGNKFVLVIDEAHRGTGKKPREEQTISARLIHGDDGLPPAPIVLGISATPKRFDNAIEASSVSRVQRKVSVPAAEVRESGLIKDLLSISYPQDGEVVENSLIREAVKYFREIDALWESYCEGESITPVRPALVLQVPHGVHPDEVADYLSVMIDEWPILRRKYAIAHCFESHQSIAFGDELVPYVAPQNIQKHESVRVVIFKEALTTGWDCPRAEVMVSLRRAQDETYVAQLIGRMVRTPLARRIEKYEDLNRVRMFLPYFDREAVLAVKTRLESDDLSLPIDIEIDVETAVRNPHINSMVFELFEELPSYEVPSSSHRSQVVRLMRMAALLSGDGIENGPIESAYDLLICCLDSELGRLKSEGLYESLVGKVTSARLETMNIGDSLEFESDATIQIAKRDLDIFYRKCSRFLKEGLAPKYLKYLIDSTKIEIYLAKAIIILLAMNRDVLAKLESASEELVNRWSEKFEAKISALNEQRRGQYLEIRELAREPELNKPQLPTGSISMPSDVELPRIEGHLFSNDDGMFVVRFGSAWEERVVKAEIGREGFCAWYRNPTGGLRSIRIPFKDSGALKYGKMYPDFIFFHMIDNQIRASIVDPHGHHLGDASGKLRALANYAAVHHDAFDRILSVIKLPSGEFRSVEHKDESVREAIRNARTKEEIEEVFLTHGVNY